MNKRVIWSPQPRQAAFMARPEYEVLYGGAAGGGKSDALLMEALRQVNIPHYRGILFRKTFPQLTDLIDRSRQMYRSAFPRARYNSTEHCWSFPSGAKIYFGNMPTDKDRLNYQGKQYDFVGFDELTHFSWEQYSYLMSRNRPGGPGTRVYMRASSNPGGIGHGWVKERFISCAPPMNTVWSTMQVETPDGTIDMIRSRIFVPAQVFDNQELLKNDPNYLANIAMMPEAEKRALLYGDWDSFSGQVFTEWKNDPKHYRDGLWTHVVEPVPIPKHWRVWRSFDWGFKHPFSVGWYAANENGRIWRIAEYYGCTGEPNVGVELSPPEVAAGIRRTETEHPLLKGRKIAGVADPSIFERSRGESIADMMEASPNFITFEPGDNTRMAGKMQFHYRLAFDDGGEPMFQTFTTCRHFIRTIPALVYDERHVEDIDTNGEDHIYDELRYLLMLHPISPRIAKERKPREDDPLDLQKGNKDKYRFYRV